MKIVVVLFIAITMAGCMAVTPKRLSVGSNVLYTQIGADVYSPNDSGWFLAQSNGFGVAFGKQYGKDSAIVNTVIFKVEGFDSDSAFLSHIEEQREKQDDKSRFKILTVKNEQVSFKSASCLKYSGVSEDHKNSGINSLDFQYFKTSGYICRHPYNSDIAFQMEVSHRSSEKVFPEILASVRKEFYSNIKFTENGLK